MYVHTQCMHEYTYILKYIYEHINAHCSCYFSEAVQWLCVFVYLWRGAHLLKSLYRRFDRRFHVNRGRSRHCALDTWRRKTKRMKMRGNRKRKTGAHVRPEQTKNDMRASKRCPVIETKRTTNHDKRLTMTWAVTFYDVFRENWLFLFTMIFTIEADAELSNVSCTCMHCTGCARAWTRE